MKWLILAVLTKLIGMIMDALLDCWRKRQETPLTQKQVRRRQVARLLIAAVSCALYAWFAAALFDFATADKNATAGAVGALLAVGAALFARSTWRRWAAIKTSRFVEDQMGRRG